MRALADPTERPRLDTLLAAEHFLGPRFPAGDLSADRQAGSISSPSGPVTAWLRSPHTPFLHRT
jgi:hypothetical protein